MFNDHISTILSKFAFQPNTSTLFSIEFSSNPDVFSSDSCLPEFHLKSSKQFDKNLCFANVKLTIKLKENIFPKRQYKIPEDTLPKLPKVIEKIKLDDLFGSVKKTSIDVFANNFNIDNIEESLLRQKIKEIIAKGKVVPYEKKQTSEALLVKREWYLLGMRTFGPYQDKEIYGFLKRYCNSEHPPGSKFMIWEAINDIFYTPETCYEEIIKLYGITGNTDEALVLNETMRMPFNDFEAMKNNIMMNRRYSMNLTNTNDNTGFTKRAAFRKFTKDFYGINMGHSFKGNFGFGANQTQENVIRSFDRKRSYQIQNKINIPVKDDKISGASGGKVVKEIEIDPFEEDELESKPQSQSEVQTQSHLQSKPLIKKEENVKIIDVNELFA